jgi:hypothetical protein
MKYISEYNEYVNQLKEGLIHTYSINVAIKNLNRTLGLNKVIFASDIDPMTNTMFFKIKSKTINLEKLFKFFNDINLYGYFISNYTFYDPDDNQIDYLIHQTEIDKDFIKDLIEKIENSYLFQIVIESKFNEELKLPGKLYHTTLLKNEKRIFEQGLTPRSGNKKANHRNRIYLGLDKINTKGLSRQFGIGEFILIEVDTTNLNIRIFEDPDFSGYGCYTYDNIPPDNLKIIDKWIINPTFSN